MKDQAHYNITPDQGWSKLRPILDDAMPVNRPPRRFAFLWWSTSAVLMSGVVGLFVFNGLDFFTQPIKTEMPVIESNQIKDASSFPKENELKANESKVNTGSAEPIITEPNQKSTPSKSKPETKQQQTIKAVTPVNKNKKPIQTEPIAAVDVDQENVVDNSIIATSATSAALPSEQSNEELTQGEVAIIPVTMPNSTQRNEQITESIPVLYASSIETGETNSNLITPVKANKVKSATPFIQPTIAASGLIGMNGGAGASASVGADLNVSRRFSVTTGIGYMGYRPDASFLSRAQDASFNPDYNAILNYDPIYASEGINTYVDGTSFNSAAGYNAINPLVENLHQWQVSGGVKWKMSPRLYMDAGVIIGFGTTAYSEYPIVSGDPQSIGSGLKIGNTLNSYDVIRSTMTSLYGGIGYNAGKHFDVFAQWTHGLDSYILSDAGSQTSYFAEGSRTDYIRGLNLGLRYTL